MKLPLAANLIQRLETVVICWSSLFIGNKILDYFLWFGHIMAEKQCSFAACVDKWALEILFFLHVFFGQRQASYFPCNQLLAVA